VVTSAQKNCTKSKVRAEVDLSRGQVSWVSPVARALMKAHESDIVDVRAPSGVEQIEVLEIRYGSAPGETE
jgi:transcription elongation factor GreB